MRDILWGVRRESLVVVISTARFSNATIREIVCALDAKFSSAESITSAYALKITRSDLILHQIHHRSLRRRMRLRKVLHR